VRETAGYYDEIYLAGFGAPESCTAIRRCRSSLIVAGGLPVTDRVTGDALTVLHMVVTGGTIVGVLTDLVQRALSVNF
jgi:hypothetical protein